MAPSFDDIVTPGELVSFIGYGCPPKDGSPRSYTGQLLPFSGGPTVSVPLMWRKDPDGSHQACGWLAGKIDSPLQPGLWTFEPPANLGDLTPSTSAHRAYDPAPAR